MRMRIVIGISGASGAPYAMRLLEVLSSEPLRERVQLSLVLSSTAEQVLLHECDKNVRELGLPIFEGRDYGAPFASGSSAPDAMVIIPASMSTVAKVALGISDNLLTRAADVVIKERKRLIMVPRETPYSEIHLTNLLALAKLGVTVLPASPSFYGKPETVGQLLDTVIGRICDHLGLPHQLTRRWGEPASAPLAPSGHADWEKRR
ncbi:MAG: 3-polyprenyl-4-hydroxybenzoate carboxy-lyase UbiX [Myxococcaceae bacterium]|nr:3-polyprenyl-4-hydroxybenzoate carboxy-lyase UbiX [Myxococcaceae bacterium]